MAWGFAQLEGCILIYSNWNGKAKMTRTLTFLLRYSQAGSELDNTHSPAASLLT